MSAPFGGGLAYIARVGNSQSMRDWPRILIALCWISWTLYWWIAARGVKPVRAQETLASRLQFAVPMFLVGLLLFVHVGPRWFFLQIVPGGWLRYWIAVGLIVGGLLFSIRARTALGRNWSGRVTVKAEHELIERGPYRRIRHPIYTGMLLALLGTGMAAGRVYGALAFVLALFCLARKARLEERWMMREFGERYAEYRRRSWALLPWIY